MDEILKYLIDNDKIDLIEIKQEIELKENKRYLEKHEYEIWQGKNGKWYTYLPDADKGRVQRQRNSRKEIEALIISYHKKQEENSGKKQCNTPAKSESSNEDKSTSF